MNNENDVFLDRIACFMSGKEDAAEYFENNDVSMQFLYACYQSGDRGLKAEVLNYVEGEMNPGIIVDACPEFAELLIDEADEFTLIYLFESFKAREMFPQALKCLKNILGFHTIANGRGENSCESYDGDDNCIIALKYLSEYYSEGKGAEKDEKLAKYYKALADSFEKQ